MTSPQPYYAKSEEEFDRATYMAQHWILKTEVIRHAMENGFEQDFRDKDLYHYGTGAHWKSWLICGFHTKLYRLHGTRGGNMRNFFILELGVTEAMLMGYPKGKMAYRIGPEVMYPGLHGRELEVAMRHETNRHILLWADEIEAVHCRVSWKPSFTQHIENLRMFINAPRGYESQIKYHLGMQE